MGGQAGLLGMMWPLLLFIVIFYFLLIRPQKKRQKQHQDMLNSIKRGDQVVTAGGIYGTVRDVKDDSFILEVSDGVKIRVLKNAISFKRSAPEADETESEER
ncbi:MAG: preprotein translocase subunit YajC [Acetomicrobium sp.]|uniref:preprotein translocase subunit YajC n=1 Tax=Acetomicrobium TaxID=49894 RepID=UPI0026F295F2|nr:MULTISPECIES: preprotein translocase subunit YajC [Acetomicrobium]MDI9376752.1 preprotein translocase subunit YajC [Synergistota bacterium]MDR9770318.1 preprotein translocase subunit YajC [Acetomicrobium sp.]HOM96896.1 preprotein translocase subunit YajC [Acetomicrobium sp.]HQA36152.1 preprotein translocase subunit YajC [Acetomicrobium sp.]HQC88127.1 preprotein translocase subunit YajC [Acetomicrobium sp.]